MAVTLDSPPPMPPVGQAAGGPSYPAMMRGGGPQQAAAPMGASPGASQLGGAAARLGMEIDQSLKLLAQALPTLGPWVEQVVNELRTQIGMAISQGAMPTSPAPAADNAAFPTGTGRL